MRGKKVDWSGKVQGQLTVLKEDGKDRFGNRLWLCKCECGNTVHKSNHSLHQGSKTCSVACGVAISNKERAKHGMWRTKEYKTWVGIKQRCLNPNNGAYFRYGGKGITIDPKWIDSFESFYADVGKAPDDSLSLDRIDNSKGYTKSNVRWTTQKVQMNNRSNTLRAEVDGFEGTLVEIGEHFGVNYMTVYQRYARGLRGADLITKQPLGRKGKSYRYD